MTELTEIVVFSRKDYDKKAKKSVIMKQVKKIIFIKNKPINISSTQIRKKYINLMEISEIKNQIEIILDNNKAKNIVSIDLKKKSYIADYMIIASGTSSRHLQSLSENLVSELKKIGIYNCRMEGKDSSDWKLVDAIDIIIHIFHPEKREFYDLEKMWSEPIPKEKY